MIDLRRYAVSGALLRSTLVALLASCRLGRLLLVVARRPQRAVLAEVPGVAVVLPSVHIVSPLGRQWVTANRGASHPGAVAHV